jgi:formamidopyrimidine-DNA glycosylase
VPELPDVTVYVERLRALVVGQPIVAIRIASPFVLRSVSPSPRELVGAKVTGIERIGKRIVIAIEGERFIVIHLMIAGRLRWEHKAPAKLVLAVFEFPSGKLVFTEASKKKRASLHVVAGRAALAEFDRGGLDVMTATTTQFAERLKSERHTVKRALTDPTLFDGIGNAYSDEILHAAKLSPLRLTRSMTGEEIERLFRATRETLERWTDRLREHAAGRFPERVTAFHDAMAVHGRYKLPCPVCGAPVQHIVYAENECNYCARCQTGGRLLADRSLSRLLKDDWPRSIDDL